MDPYGCEKRMMEVEKRVDDFHMKIIEEQRKKKEKEVKKMMEIWTLLMFFYLYR